MMKPVIIFLCILTIPAHAQPQSADSAWNAIIKHLAIPKDFCYENLESAFSEDTLRIGVLKRKNLHEENVMDLYYILNYEKHKVFIYKSGLSQCYFLTRIEISLSGNYAIASLFPYQTIEQFRNDKYFGVPVKNMTTETELVYEIEADWNYLALRFQDGRVNQVALSFRLE